MVRAKRSANNDPSYRTLKAEYYPVQRTMDLRSTGTEVDYYVCYVGRCLSTMNHRLYRQGKTYSVKIDLHPGQADTYDVYALVDTWYIQKAWQLARKVYLDNMAHERSVMSKQQVARWEDFRVNAGLSGWTGNQLVPSNYSNGMASSARTDGEFALTEITLADGTTNRSFTWAGTSGSELGILAEYDKSGGTDPAPATSSGPKAYAGVEGDVSESSMDHLQEKGDLPPYNNTNFDTRVWVRIARLDGAATHGKLSTGYFNAPCGLIVVQPTAPNSAVVNNVQLTVKAGNYKGVHAMNMGA